MAVVFIPAAIRSLTGGSAKANSAGSTLGEVIDNLDIQFSGLKARLIEGDRLRPGMAAFVDGSQVTAGLRTRITETSEIYFTPAIAGG